MRWSHQNDESFTFTEKWSFSSGVYRNSFGQLSYDGIPGGAVEKFKDSTGYIPPQSRDLFYSLVDTTRRYHTLSMTGWCYEWAGSHFMDARTLPKGAVRCVCRCSRGTHCSLILVLTDSVCRARVHLNSITRARPVDFRCSSGAIEVDRELLRRDTLRATFDFIFRNHLEPKTPIWFRGKIFTPVRQE
ncbi:MAG: hypothetical protein ACQEQV_07320 [Fibrobacterota bacterium]